MQPIPSLSVIQFPGKLKNPDDPSKAIRALGGEHEVRRACKSSINDPNFSLNINLRPGNETSKSNITAEAPVQYRNRFLLRITTTSSSSDLEDQTSETTSTVDVTLVGKISSAIRFRCLSDFQYHPFHNTTTCAQFEKVINGNSSSAKQNDSSTLSENQIVANKLHNLFLNQDLDRPDASEEEMISRFRPSRFSRAAPEHGTTDFWFRQHITLQKNNEEPKDMQLKPGKPLGQDRRSAVDRLHHLHHRVPHTVEAVPSAPIETNVSIRSRGREEYTKLLTLLQEVFRKRPIWIRRALYEGIPMQLRRAFKRVIAKLAYSFQGTGPFYQAWIRYGYDPRKDSSSRKYQVIDIRCTDPTMLAVALRHAERNQSKKPDVVKEEGFTMPTSFTLSELPLKKNSFVQVCDISLPQVRKVCNEEPLTNTFDMKTGFFTKRGYARLQMTIKETLKKLTQEVARDLASTPALDASHFELQRGKKRKLLLRDIMKPQLTSRRYRKNVGDSDQLDTSIKDTEQREKSRNLKIASTGASNEKNTSNSSLPHDNEKNETFDEGEIDMCSKDKSMNRSLGENNQTDVENTVIREIQNEDLEIQTDEPFEVGTDNPYQEANDADEEYEILGGDDDDDSDFSDDMDDEE